MEKDKIKLIEEIREFDAGFPDGIYAIPMTKKVKVHALIDYGQKKGVSIDSLDEREILQFVERV